LKFIILDMTPEPDHLLVDAEIEAMDTGPYPRVEDEVEERPGDKERLDIHNSQVAHRGRD